MTVPAFWHSNGSSKSLEKLPLRPGLKSAPDAFRIRVGRFAAPLEHEPVVFHLLRDEQGARDLTFRLRGSSKPIFRPNRGVGPGRGFGRDAAPRGFARAWPC